MAIGTAEILLILGVALLLFCADKLPEIARAMGKALGEFKKAQREAELELKSLEKPIVQQTESEIRKLAREMGISTEGKSDEQLREEIKALKARALGIAECQARLSLTSGVQLPLYWQYILCFWGYPIWIHLKNLI
ncbi:MAG: twin-arginine translocase TatA/TatE family subunit [Methanocellales archaeon]